MARSTSGPDGIDLQAHLHDAHRFCLIGAAAALDRRALPGAIVATC